jgi:hypothetical protein
MEVPLVSLFAGPNPGVDGVGTNAALQPTSLALSPDGTYALISESSQDIRKLIISTGSISSFAGVPGYSGNTDGIGTEAKFQDPNEVAISSDGTYAMVVDTGNSVIRKIIISTASVTTFAGTLGTSGDTNGVGTNASFASPRDIGFSVDETFALVADSNNYCIRQITLSTASVTQFAGACGSVGNVNGVGTNAKFRFPVGIAFSPSGTDVLVVDYSNHVIRQIILSTASVTTLVGSGSYGASNGLGTNVQFYTPYRVDISSDGAYALVTEVLSCRIRHITLTTTSVDTLAGSSCGYADGVPEEPMFNFISLVLSKF